MVLKIYFYLINIEIETRKKMLKLLSLIKEITYANKNNPLNKNSDFFFAISLFQPLAQPSYYEYYSCNAIDWKKKSVLFTWNRVFSSLNEKLIKQFDTKNKVKGKGKKRKGSIITNISNTVLIFVILRTCSQY